LHNFPGILCWGPGEIAQKTKRNEKKVVYIAMAYTYDPCTSLTVLTAGGSLTKKNDCSAWQVRVGKGGQGGGLVDNDKLLPFLVVIYMQHKFLNRWDAHKVILFFQ